MRERAAAGSPVAAVLACLTMLASDASGGVVYRVRMNTLEFTGSERRIAIDLTSGSAPINYVRIGAFATDGRRGQSLFQGGPVSGGLVDGLGPAAATIGDSAFYNQLIIPLDSVGTTVTFDIAASENAVPGVPDETSVYFLNADESFPFPTLDPLGTNALLAIDVTGQSGGDLGVFAPMEFVPPDTIRMSKSTTAVISGEGVEGRLKFRSAAPNPSLGAVRLVYEVPEPGGLLRVRVFDVAGRLLAEPFSGRRAPGTWTTYWDGMGSKGRAAPTGVYIVQVQMGGQSLVRRVVLTR